MVSPEGLPDGEADVSEAEVAAEVPPEVAQLLSTQITLLY